MKKELPKKRKNRPSPAPRQEASFISQAQPSTSGKACPVGGRHLKRKRESDSENPNPLKEDLRVRVLKKRCREDGEGPSTDEERPRKKGRCDPQQDDGEIPSTSTDTGSCARTKRMLSAEGEGLSKKRRRKKDGPYEETPMDKFTAKYEEQEQLGEGGCGSVFAGYRKKDKLPVAIKHIPKDKVFCTHVDQNGKGISVEIAVMEKLAAANQGSENTSAPVSLLDWYDLGKELILVLERPIPAVDLLQYLHLRDGPLQEDEAQVILKQLVDAAKELEDMSIFHRDIKLENILIETGSDVPRVRLIDFGLSCFAKGKSCYKIFFGTEAHGPPEWFRRSHYKPGPTTVWQMGVVLYETLHCKGVFHTEEYLQRKFPISKKLSTDCQDFLRACFTRNPKRRPTLAELQDHPWLKI